MERGWIVYLCLKLRLAEKVSFGMFTTVITGSRWTDLSQPPEKSKYDHKAGDKWPSIMAFLGDSGVITALCIRVGSDLSGYNYRRVKWVVFSEWVVKVNGVCVKFKWNWFPLEDCDPRRGVARTGLWDNLSAPSRWIGSSPHYESLITLLFHYFVAQVMNNSSFRFWVVSKIIIPYHNIWLYINNKECKDWISKLLSVKW